MRDHEDAELVGFLGAVHAFGHDAQGVHVQAGVGFVKDGKLRFQQFELQHFGALLFTAGEAFVHGTGGELRVHLEALHGCGQVLGPLANTGSLAVDFGLGGAQEVGHGHARYFDRVLHGQEQAGLGALVRSHLEDVLAVEEGLAGVDHVLGVAGQRVGESGLAGTVGAHDGVGFAGVDGQGGTLQDRLDAFLGFDVDVQVLDFEC